MSKVDYKSPRGEAHPKAKLTAEQVRAIRAAHTTGEWTYKALAGKYGLTPTNIAAIVNRRSWKEID